MELLIASPFAKIGLIRRDIERLSTEGRDVMVLAFEQPTINLLEDISRKEGVKGPLLINSVMGDEMKSLLMFATLIGKYDLGIIDELYGAYLVRVSSSPREEAFKIQRKIIMLISLIRYLESLKSSLIKIYTSIRPEEWFSNLFDNITMK